MIPPILQNYRQQMQRRATLEKIAELGSKGL